MPRSRRWPRTMFAAFHARWQLFRSGSVHHADAALTRLADELAVNERELRSLLAGDGRDTADIPGFDSLTDRQREIVGQLCLLPAQGVDGLVAKARGIRLRDPAMGYDGAGALGWSLAGDVLRCFGRDG